MRTCIVTLALLLGSPALAAPQAEGAGDAHYYTGDDDHDGVANWRDSDSELYVVDDVGFHAFNVLLLLGVVFWFARRPIRDTLRERALGIRRELTDTARERDEARQRYEELEARLAGFATELEAMRAEAAREAQAEEQKLIERAHSEAARVAEMAQRNIRDEVTRAQLELRKEAVELAVQLAEATLARNVAPEDQLRLAREFLDSLNNEAANA